MIVNGKPITYNTELIEILDVSDLKEIINDLELECHQYKTDFNQIINDEMSTGLGESALIIDGVSYFKEKTNEVLTAVDDLPDTSFFTYFLEVASNRRKKELSELLEKIDERLESLNSTTVNGVETLTASAVNDEYTNLVKKREYVQAAYDECATS